MTTFSSTEKLMKDASFFKKCANLANDSEIIFHYTRASLVFYCAWAEAWINTQLRKKIYETEIKKRPQVELLNFFNSANLDKIPPHGYSNISKRLYSWIPAIYNNLDRVIEDNIFRNEKETDFSDFIRMTRLRNSIMHFTSGMATYSFTGEFEEELSELSVMISDSQNILASFIKSMNSTFSEFAFPEYSIL